ncbi:hypothetical protein ROZALSC1DRAFT_29792 [Rozella allomycis CSF55]|uniref:Capsular polysaccharide synthesis protein n=1 Tax=Rozella allomycis (strain CSF55) TaxID=988480 RepID=A0A4P9YGC3_ROZAC|nr:hypothetical protein ROZALSC1DRAFT_29792 [Rozella allomycis CSF55]
MLIWTYWDSDNDSDIPRLVSACMKSWKQHAGDHVITMIRPSGIKTHIRRDVPKEFVNWKPQFKADWIRLAVLSEHGGIWLDASILITRDLGYIHEKQRWMRAPVYGYHLDGYTVDGNFPVFENWLIAAVRDSATINAWFAETEFAFTRFANDSDKEDLYDRYLQEKFGMDVYLQLKQKIDISGYLKMHMALQKIMQIDGAPVPRSDAAEFYPNGPYMYVYENNWEMKKSMQKLMKKATQEFYPIYKFNGYSRIVLEELLKEGEIIEEGSLLGKYFHSQ